MKKRDIFLVVFIIMFGLFYEFYESGEMNLFEGCYISPKRLLDKTHRITITAQEKSFSDLTYFKVENPAGEIRIEKSPDNNTVIKPVIYVYHRNREKGDKIRKKIKINYKRENKKVIVEIDNRWRFPYRRVRILFKVFVPDGVELNLDNTYGDLTIEKIASDMKIKNRHGEVGLSDID